MPAETLNKEVEKFNFLQIEKQFICGGSSSSTCGQQQQPATGGCSKSAKKNKAKRNASNKQTSGCSAASSAAAAVAPTGCPQRNVDDRIVKLESRVDELEKVVEQLKNELRLLIQAKGQVQICPQKPQQTCQKPGPAAAPKKPAGGDDDDDDVDLFGSDDDEAANELREKRLAEYSAKKSKKPAVVAKSSVVLDVKPWDDETDMAAMEKAVRSIEMDGLVWGASKLVPLAYGIKKLQIVCVIEDDKVSVEELSEKIEAFEDYVQSVDVAAFNKI